MPVYVRQRTVKAGIRFWGCGDGDAEPAGANRAAAVGWGGVSGEEDLAVRGSKCEGIVAETGNRKSWIR